MNSPDKELEINIFYNEVHDEDVGGTHAEDTKDCLPSGS